MVMNRIYNYLVNYTLSLIYDIVHYPRYPFVDTTYYSTSCPNRTLMLP